MVTIPLRETIVTKNELGMLQPSNKKESKDCINIDRSGSKNGLIESINNLNGGVSGCPNNKKMLAIKQQFVRSTGHAVVILFEIHPDPGNIWINVYNQEWKGWKLVGG